MEPPRMAPPSTVAAPAVDAAWWLQRKRWSFHPMPLHIRRLWLEGSNFCPPKKNGRMKAAARDIFWWILGALQSSLKPLEFWNNMQWMRMFSFRIVCQCGDCNLRGHRNVKAAIFECCSQGMNAMEFGEIPYLRSLCNLGSASLSHDSEVTSQCPHNFPKGVEILQVKHSQSPPKIDVHILHWNYSGWCSRDCTFWKLLHTRYISHILACTYDEYIHI